MVADSLNKCKIVHSIQYGLGIQPNFAARVVAAIFKAAQPYRLWVYVVWPIYSNRLGNPFKVTVWEWEWCMPLFIVLNVDLSNGEIPESANLSMETFFPVLHG